MSHIHESFSRNIKAIRKERKLSQQEVAEKADMLASTFSRIENLKVSPSLDTIIRIAEALEVSPKEFFQSREIKDKGLVEKLAMLNDLSEYNRNVVEIMMDSILEKDKLEKLLNLKKQKRLEELERVRRGD